MKDILFRILMILILFSVWSKISGCKNETEQVPQKQELLPAKENLWVFMMAGQSNMAGRGKIESQDLVTNKRILTIDENNQWIIAREPLHFYEPKGAGLDCGMSFARELLKHVPDSVSIAMMPCAVGGSSVFEWLGDSLHRNVKLLSNFRWKVDLAKDKGVIKCILWHQGERNANSHDIPLYEESLEILFSKFRALAGNSQLPIILGELGRFAKPQEKQEMFDQVNEIVRQVAQENPNCFFISSDGLTHKGDYLHFDSRSLRELGKRYAEKYIEITAK